MLELLRVTGFEPMTATYWNTFLFPAAVALRVWRKFADFEGSDLKTGSAQSATRLFAAMLRGERALIRHFPLPFGLSVFAVGRKV